MRISVDHLAASEQVDCQEVKGIAMDGGVGLHGICKHLLAPQASCSGMFLLGGSTTGKVTLGGSPGGASALPGEDPVLYGTPGPWLWSMCPSLRQPAHGVA